MCWEESYPKFLSWGIEPERMIVFYPEKKEACTPLKKKNDAVFFLVDPLKGYQYPYRGASNYGVDEIIRFVEKVASIEPNLVVKPHPHLFMKFEDKLNKFKVTWDNADDLINSSDRVYSFQCCTTVKDASIQGKKAIIVEQLA
jgi:hypothetical protein